MSIRHASYRVETNASVGTAFASKQQTLGHSVVGDEDACAVSAPRAFRASHADGEAANVATLYIAVASPERSRKLPISGSTARR